MPLSQASISRALYRSASWAFSRDFSNCSSATNLPSPIGVVHGLRLNFIEFYNWALVGEGYPFKPFKKTELEQ